MRTKSFTSFLFALLFSYPLLYQPLHYFEHLHEEEKDMPNCDQSSLTESSELCAVCAYEMAISDRPLEDQMTSTPFTLAVPVYIYVVEKKLTPSLFYKSLRAPPTIS